MSLPYQPETIEQVRKRLPQAINFVYDVDKVSKNEMSIPDENRENTFDFTDGMRLVIARESKDDKTVLHISAFSFKKTSYDSKDFLNMILEKLIAIQLLKEGILFVVTIKNNVMHLIFPEREKEDTESWSEKF